MTDFPGTSEYQPIVIVIVANGSAAAHCESGAG
ncbi:hypothetical protein PSAB6_450167 [Paraburkholderia sabiae]|nr:hypothetical protein PSAB6_450167 [Paraburkholderia sabiae]